MSSPIYSSMRSGSLQRQRTILREKQKTKGKAQKRKTTKEHFAEQAALTRHKLKKRAVSQGGADPWIVGESYTLKIPEDQFEVLLQLCNRPLIP